MGPSLRSTAKHGYTERVLLQGLYVPLSCPFYRDGGLYLRKLEHNVARYSLSPAAGLVALPPAGEAGALTDAEAGSFLEAVGQTAGKEKVLVAGVERASVYAAVQLAQIAERAGFDAILLAPPPDWARLVRDEDARELVMFYEAVAEQSPLPVVFWSDAKPPYLQLPTNLLARLARHPNVLGVLDADLTEARLAAIRAATVDVRRDVTVTTIFEAVTRRMLKPEPEVASASSGFVTLESLSSAGAGVTAATLPAPLAGPPPAPALKTRTRTVGFQVLSGASAHSMVPLLAAGASGACPALAACAPQGCFEAYAAWKDGNPALAEERAGRLIMADEVVDRLGPAAIKAGCDFNGYYGGQPRLPRLPLTGEHRAEMERVLALIRN